MRFAILAGAFEQLVSTVISVSQKTTTMPVLSHVLVRVAGSTIMLTGSDAQIEAGARGKLASLESEGAICVEASKLSALLRSFDGDKLVSFQIERDQALLKCGRSRFKLATLPAENFPNIDCDSEAWRARGVEVDAETFLAQIARVSPAMAQNDTRHFLNGMLIEIVDNQLNLVATDGHRLAKSVLDAEGAANSSCILPRKLVGAITRSFNKKGTLELSLSETHFDIRNNETRLTSNVIEGKYPDYTRVIPNDVAFIASMESKRLIGAMKRSLITSQDQTKAVRLHFGERLLIESHNAYDEACKEEMDVEWAHEPLEVAFNGAYLQDALASVKSDDCNLAFQDSKGTLTIRPIDHADRFCVVLMPCRH